MEAPIRSQDTEKTGNVPPQNIEAEISVLGAILLDGGEGSATARVMELLKAEHFYRMSHRVIFEAMMELFDKKESIDYLTVVDALRRSGNLDNAHGPEYVMKLADDISTTRRAVPHARMIRSTAMLRGLIYAADAIADRAYSDEADADIVIDDAERAIFEVTSDRSYQKVETMKDIVVPTFQHLENLFDRKEMITGVPSGFLDIDKLTSGFQKGELIIIAGRPSMGKTAFALCIAEYAAANAQPPTPTAIFSLEMSARALAIRMMCGRAMVNARQLQTGYMSSNRWPDLTRAAGELSEAPIFVDDSTNLTVFDIRAKCRRMAADQGLGLIVIDYLQLISSRSQRIESRNLEVSEITRSLKNLAKELDVPVIALSQLSRQVESREGKRPNLADLRESGSIEQDADVVALLYREDYYDKESEKKGEATVIIAKQRNGPTDDVQLRFFDEYARFVNLDTFHERPSDIPEVSFQPDSSADSFQEEEEVGF